MRQLGRLLGCSRPGMAHMDQRRLRLLQARIQHPVARCVFGLSLKPGQLRAERDLCVLRAGEVRLRRPQLPLRLRTARMQPANAGRLLQHAPPLLRTGADDGADPPLTDHGGGSGAAGQVRKQRLHVPGAGLLTVHAVLAPAPPLDPADDL